MNQCITCMMDCQLVELVEEPVDFFFNFWETMELNVVGFDDAMNLTEQWGCLRYMGVS